MLVGLSLWIHCCFGWLWPCELVCVVCCYVLCVCFSWLVACFRFVSFVGCYCGFLLLVILSVIGGYAGSVAYVSSFVLVGVLICGFGL